MKVSIFAVHGSLNLQTTPDLTCQFENGTFINVKLIKISKNNINGNE